MKKIILFVSIVILLFSFDKAYAHLGGNSAGGGGNIPSNSTTGPDGGLPRNCASGFGEYQRSFSTPVGVLLSIVEYDVNASPQEKTVAKAIYNNGSFGTNSISYTCQTTESAVGADPGIPTTCKATDDNSTCGKDHYASTWHVVATYSWTYSLSFGDELKNDDGSAITTYTSPVTLDYNNLPYSLESDYGMLRMLLYMNDPSYSDYHWDDVLPKINERFGTEITPTNIEKYYIKVEPLYRSYSAAVSSTGDANWSGDASTESGATSDYTGGPHTHTHYQAGYCSGATGSDSGTCEDNGGDWVDAKTNNCVYYDQVHYVTVSAGGIPSTVHSARAGGSYLGLLYNSRARNEMQAKDSAGKPLGDHKDYFIGTNIGNAMVADIYKTSPASSSHSYSVKHGYNTLNNKYIFASSGSDTSDLEHKAIGMAIYALIDLFDGTTRKKCSDFCSTTDKSSDDYLKCAQSFCDSYVHEFASSSDDEHYTTVKRSCIVGTDEYSCGYVPKKPIDCKEDSPSVYNESFKNLKPGIGTNVNITGSYCGYDSQAAYGQSDRRTSDSLSKTAGYVQCERLGMVIPETINEVEVYAYGTSNTQNTYINAACKEYSSFDFKDTYNLYLKRGAGFDYYAKLYKGIRDCILFFDYEQWKFDFASTHSSDAVRKTLLLNKVKAYNELVNANSTDIMLNGLNIVTDGLAINENESSGAIEESTIRNTIDLAEGEVNTVESLEYSDSPNKIDVKTTVTEYVNKQPYTDGNIPYSQDNNTEITLDRTEITPTLEGKLLNKKGEDKLLLFNNYDYDKRIQIDEVGEQTVNRYSYYGTLESLYNLPEVCHDDDNNAKVSRTAVDGECKSLKYGYIDATRLYYTHYNATLTKELPAGTNHYVTTTIHVYPTDFNGSNSTSEYLSGDDTCPYNVVDDDIPGGGNVSCTIGLDKKADTDEPSYPEDRQVCYKADNVYITSYDTAKFKLTIKNKTSNGEQIKTYKMVAYDSGNNKVAEITDNTELSVPVTNLKFKADNGQQISDSIITVYAEVETKLEDGTTKTYSNLCHKDATIAKNGNGCKITKDETNHRYEIIPSGGGTVYVATGNVQDLKKNLVFSELAPTDGKYYVSDLNPDGREIVMARVGDGTSIVYCQYKPTSTCPSTGNNCFKACSGKTGEERNMCARNYCNSEGATDGYNYFPDCETECSGGGDDKYPCTYYIDGKQCENFDYVKEWCGNSANLALTNHPNQRDCMQKCYCQEGTPTYRPINLNNPFPNSAYSTMNGYKAGNREIGAEWKIDLETDNSIEEDKHEVNKGATQPAPEFKILLTPSSISAINADTDAINNNLETTSIYTSTRNSLNTYDYASSKYYVCSKNGNNREYTGYCSEFIHSSNFSSLFKFIDGVQASGVIGTP